MTRLTISGELDYGRLLDLISDQTRALRVTPTGPAETVILLDGSGPDLALTIPSRLPCDATWWAAAMLRRSLRRVPDAEACASPWLESLLLSGRWRHPHAAYDQPGADGVLLFKPGMTVTASALRELADRLAECGYRADQAKVLPGQEIIDSGAATAHYHPHTELARRGTLTAEERITLLRVYDRPEFQARFGTRPHDLDVVPAYRLLAEGRLTPGQLEKWSTASAELRGLDSGAVDGPNEIGDCLSVNVFQDPDFNGGEPVIVVNPHMPGVLAQLEHPENSTVAVLVSAVGRQALSWKRVSQEFCGVTDPAQALPGSLRGDALAGLFPLRGTTGEPVHRTNNGIHLSNGVAEAMHDTLTWFGVPPEQTSPGRRLRKAGTDPAAVLTHPFLELAGRRRAVATLTGGLEAERAARALQAGRRCEVDDFPGTADSVRRIDVAWQLAVSLGRAPGTAAVLVTGSVGRNRACPDSDLNLLVVHSAGSLADGRHRPRFIRNGVEVLVEYLSLDEAEWLTAAQHPSLSSANLFPTVLHRLGLAAQFTGLPLLDNQGQARRLADRAAQQSVPPALLAAHLDRVLRAVRNPRRGGRPGWSGIRSAAFALTVAALANQPVRYHKPKWVPADLRTIGRLDLWEVLCEAWQVAESSEAGVRATLRKAASPGTDHRTLADAHALLAAGRLADALFCGRFAAGAALRRQDHAGLAATPPATLVHRLTELAEQELHRSAT
ncbi:nucleoside-diphosphate kinase [Streptomyces sp. BK340]|uniref:nucleoside-diphosphate kinase n=1 Tax=Streptomyces sp. BK340 TaxID=2572903 RepID=UPI00119FD93C|nr:nucleoside-diphosphate kinase [Streptomyces sp. BK340]TVZ84920.1 hypothetical protein FB157_120187 [Streptomyces sp. BK340]